MDEDVASTSNEADIEVFKAIPWCKQLLDDPKYTIISTMNPRRFFSQRHEDLDTFMDQTLNTKDTIRACLLLHSTSPSSFTGVVADEILVLCDLGPKLSSQYNMVHGGVVTTLLDHFTGMLLRINKELLLARDPTFDMNHAYATLRLDTTFRQVIATPSTVVVRARYDKVEGRKRWLKATIEDSMGTVMAEGRALYLQVPIRPVKDLQDKL